MSEVFLPNGWAMTTFGEVADRNVDRSGATDSEFIYVDISSVDREKKCIADANVIQSAEAPSRAKQVLQSGDVLVSMTRPNLNAVAIVSTEFDGAIGSTGFHVLRSRCAEPKFLFFLVQTRRFIEEMSLCVQGALYPAVRPKDIALFGFPFPPFNEQHRIVAKIEELFSELNKGIENLKTAQAQLKVYRQALLKHAFEGKLTAQWRAERHAKQSVAPAKAGAQPLNDMDSRPTPSRGLALRGNDEVGNGNDKPLETADTLLKRIQQERAQRYQQQLADWEASGKQGSKPKPPKSLPPLTAEELAKLPELPEGWGWCKFDDVVNVDSNLVSPTDYPNSPHIAPDNIEREVGRLLAYRTVAEDEVKSPKHRFFAGQIIYSKIRPNLSKLVIAQFDGLCSADMYPLSTGLNTKFLFYLMLSKYFVSRASNSGSRTVLPKINQHELGGIALPICSFVEQAQVIDQLESKLSETDQLDQTITIALQQAEALRQSILKKAFSGQLVPQDPNDEPASELLARIKADRVVHKTIIKP